MGTSKANIGPVGYSNPIQEWNKDLQRETNSKNVTDDETDSGQADYKGNTIEEQNNTKWGDVKRSFSVFTKNPSKTNYKKFTSNYKKAAGGNKKLTKSSIGGRKGATVLLDFFTTILNDGFEQTLEKYNIGNLNDLKVEGAINKISELFTSIDGTDEGSAASGAIIETINKLYNDYSNNPELIDNLEIETISDYLEFYISTYIFERISVEVTKALENGSLTIKQVNDIESQLKSFIEAEVSLNFTEVNFSTIDIKAKNEIINQIFDEAYSLI
jgi:hypothetical protein